MGLIIGKTIISTIDVILSIILFVYMYQSRNEAENSGFKFAGVMAVLLSLNICAMWV